MIGAETERTAKSHRNEDIDSERTPLNYYFKKSEGGLAQAWDNMMQNFGATYKETKKSFAFEGLVITSGHEFFTERGYIPGEPLPRELQKFFEDCYAFALRQIGYHGTDKNILSAVIHLDETTPICNCTISLSSMKEEKRFTQRTNAAKLCAMQKARPFRQKTATEKVYLHPQN